MLTWNWAKKKLDCSTTYWMLKFLHSYLHNFSATRASQRWIAQVNHHLKQEKRKLNSPVITFKTRIMHMLPKRGKDPQVNSEDFSGLKTSFPLMLFQSPSADKLKLISRFIFQTNSVSMMASSCISFEQTDLAAESRDRNHNNTLSSDCCPITPQHECQFATYECGVNDPRVCGGGGVWVWWFANH